MARRPRTDSTEALIAAMKNAASGPHKPPRNIVLTEDELVFWDMLQASKPRSEWSETDLVVGANLAQALHALELEKAELLTEDSVLVDRFGKRYANPRVTVVEVMTKRAMSLFRALRLSGLDGVRSEEVAKARQLNKGAVAARRETVNELLA